MTPFRLRPRAERVLCAVCFAVTGVFAAWLYVASVAQLAVGR